MLKITYTGLSNFFKLISIVIAALTLFFQYQSELAKLVSICICALCSVCFILISILDKAHSEILKQQADLLKQQADCAKEFNSACSQIIEMNTNLHYDGFKKINSLEQRLQESFEYNGLLNSPKDKFTPREIKEKWPRLMQCVKSEFVGINYLSPTAWKATNGDLLVNYLGSSKIINGFHARRIFVIDSEEEKILWKPTIDLHLKYHIPVMFIFKSDFDHVRDEFGLVDATFKNVNGFNVVDPAGPGVVLDWCYSNRSMESAILLTGTSIAGRYISFFNAAWNFDLQKYQPITVDNQTISVANHVMLGITVGRDPLNINSTF